MKFILLVTLMLSACAQVNVHEQNINNNSNSHTASNNTLVNLTAPQVNTTVDQHNTMQISNWTIIITHRGTPLPQEAVDLICKGTTDAIQNWIKRESTLYNKPMPFDTLACAPEQILLPKEAQNGQITKAEGQLFTAPLNEEYTISHLEKLNEVNNSKFVTIIHYIPHDAQFINYAGSAKYDFIHIKTPHDSIPFYPPLEIDLYATTLVHELMHKLGASDKYAMTPTQACLIEPKTQQEYDGYDIMCHRIQANTGFVIPPFYELRITKPTAEEIWG